MIELVSEEDGRRIAMRMAGVITAAEIDDADERIEQSESAVGAQRILLDWTQLEGWEKGAKTVGTWVGMRHWANVAKIAILADAKWDDETMRIADIYKLADVQRFAPDDRDGATAWLNLR
jgi:Protein of unknown function (DUF3478).